MKTLFACIEDAQGLAPLGTPAVPAHSELAARPPETPLDLEPTHPVAKSPSRSGALSPSSRREPSDVDWEPFADWCPPCFGRLALEYAMRFGLTVLPVLVDGREPVGRAVPRGSADASRDPATIHAWWCRAPHANVGIACEPSGLLVLEVNPRGGGPETLAMHAERLGPLPFTCAARTAAGWTQYFFSHADPDAFALPTLRPLGPGVEVTHKSFVIAPPSVVRGRRSAWHLDGRPGRAPLAAMPAAWMDRLTGRQLPPNGLSGLDARHSVVGRAFEALGWLGRRLDDGRRLARCPWMAEHAWPGGAGCDTASLVVSLESEPWFGRFACQHPECAHRDGSHLLSALPEWALDAAQAALPGAGAGPDFRAVDFNLDLYLELLAGRPPALEAAVEAAREMLLDAGDPAGAADNDTGLAPGAGPAGDA